MPALTTCLTLCDALGVGGRQEENLGCPPTGAVAVIFLVERGSYPDSATFSCM